MALGGEREEFEKRWDALAGQRDVLAKRIAEVEAKIAGEELKLAAYRLSRSPSLTKRPALPTCLPGLITRARTLQLQRTNAGPEGRSAQPKQPSQPTGRRSRLSGADRSAAENRAAEISKDLSDTRSQSLDVGSRRQNAAAVLERTEIWAPYPGEIVNLGVSGTGPVIGRAKRSWILSPTAPLVVEGHVRVQDISELHPAWRRRFIHVL